MEPGPEGSREGSGLSRFVKRFVEGHFGIRKGVRRGFTFTTMEDPKDVPTGSVTHPYIKLPEENVLVLQFGCNV